MKIRLMCFTAVTFLLANIFYFYFEGVIALNIFIALMLLILYVFNTVFKRYILNTLYQVIADTDKALKRITLSIKHSSLNSVLGDDNFKEDLDKAFLILDDAEKRDKNVSDMLRFLIYSIIDMRVELLATIERMRVKSVERINEIRKSGVDIFTEAYFKQMPVVDTEYISSNKKTVHISSITQPYLISAGECTIIHKSSQDKLIIIAFDLSGHGLDSSYHAVILRNFIDYYFTLFKYPFSVDFLAHYLIDFNKFMGSDTAEIYMLEVDLGNGEYKSISFGDLYLSAFDVDGNTCELGVGIEFPKYMVLDDEEMKRHKSTILFNRLSSGSLNNIDSIFIATDGVYGMRLSDGRRLGKEGITEYLKVNKHKSIKEIDSDLVCKQDSSCIPEDDRTIVKIKFGR